MFMRVGMLFLIYHCAQALSVAIWVCSSNRAATTPASSALLTLLFMFVPPGFIVEFIRGGHWAKVQTCTFLH